MNDCGVDVNNRMVAASWMSCSENTRATVLEKEKQIAGTKTQNCPMILRSHMEMIAYWVADIPNVFETAQSNTRHKAGQSSLTGASLLQPEEWLNNSLPLPDLQLDLSTSKRTASVSSYQWEQLWFS